MLVNKLGDDLYLLTGDTYQSNSTALISEDEVMLVDGMASAADAQNLRRWVETDLRKQVRFIVCTHYFSDHLAALNVFPRATVVAHRNYLETFESERFCSPEEKTHFREPDVLISDQIEFRWGQYRLDIFHNPGHTSSTLSIDLRPADLLMVGDNLVGNIVYFLYSTPGRMDVALERLSAKSRTRVLSGHGGVRSSDAIHHAKFYLRNLSERSGEARKSIEGERALLQVPLEACLPVGVEATAYEKVYHERNLQTILERGFF
jgi:glyoxylase-like metal-dependent hydrolase (beta-lactamase superfamily II)